MKKLFSMIVVLLLYTSAMVHAQYPDERNEFTLNGITYVVTSDSTVSVAGRRSLWGQSLNDMEGYVVLPSKVFDYTLTGIESDAFAWSRLSSIDIPETVTSIGTSPFYKSGLESIKLPNSIKELNQTFCSCYHLKTVEIPRSVEELKGTFIDSAIESVVIPNTVRKLGDNCFFMCSQLRDVILEGDREKPLTLGSESIAGKISNLDITPIDTIESYAYARHTHFYDHHFGSVGVVKPLAFYGYGDWNYGYPKEDDTGLSLIFDSVDTICDSAFVYSRIETLIIPENAKVGKRFLPDYGSLKNLVFHLPVPPYNDVKELRVLTARIDDTFLFVPEESLATYRSIWPYGQHDRVAFKDILPLDDYYSGAYKNWNPWWLDHEAIEEVNGPAAGEMTCYSIDGRKVDANHKGLIIVRESNGETKKVLR